MIKTVYPILLIFLIFNLRDALGQVTIYPTTNRGEETPKPNELNGRLKEYQTVYSRNRRDEKDKVVLLSRDDLKKIRKVETLLEGRYQTNVKLVDETNNKVREQIENADGYSILNKAFYEKTFTLPADINELQKTKLANDIINKIKNTPPVIGTKINQMGLLVNCRHDKGSNQIICHYPNFQHNEFNLKELDINVSTKKIKLIDRNEDRYRSRCPKNNSDLSIRLPQIKIDLNLILQEFDTLDKKEYLQPIKITGKVISNVNDKPLKNVNVNFNSTEEDTFSVETDDDGNFLKKIYLSDVSSFDFAVSFNLVGYDEIKSQVNLFNPDMGPIILKQKKNKE